MCFTNPLRPGLTVLFHRIYRFPLTAQWLCQDPARAAETGVSFSMDIQPSLAWVSLNIRKDTLVFQIAIRVRKYSVCEPEIGSGLLASFLSPVTRYTCFWICICWNITWLLTWRYSYHLSCLLERSFTLQAQGHKVFDDRNDEEGQIQTI